MGLNLNDKNIRQHMLEGKFGLEKESLRVDGGGFLSHTKHPFPDNPRMERDFCENQLEIITGVNSSVDAAWEELALLQTEAVRKLYHLGSGREFLWPFSNPPYVKGEDDIPIAAYKGVLRGKEQYRRYLAEKYGKRKMLFSGIHFNFSFSDAFLEAAFEAGTVEDFRVFTDSLYLELAKKVTRYSWLIVYLTAASPCMDASILPNGTRGEDLVKNYASPRCSEIGYWNDFIPILEYHHFSAYIESIQSYVEQGQLKEAAELYYPVRLKPDGNYTLDHLRENGINHIELRMLDLNPLTPIGIEQSDLRFLQVLILWVLSCEDTEFAPFEQVMAIKNMKRAARFDEDSIRIETGWDSALPVKDAAMRVLQNMVKFCRGLEEPQLLDAVYAQVNKLIVPGRRYADRVRADYGTGYVEAGMRLAKRYAEQADRAELTDDGSGTA